MKQNTILKGAFVALCLISLLALPAAAASTGQATTTAKAGAIDQGLKDDLWANHEQYRLEIFDMGQQRANSIITILDKYGIDTTSCQATLSAINSKRSDLVTALNNKDQDALKTVNDELKTLWEQFRTETRDAIRAHYGIKTTDRAGMNESEDLASVTG